MKTTTLASLHVRRGNLYIYSARVADTSSPIGLAFAGFFGPTSIFDSNLSGPLASFIQTTSFFYSDILARLASGLLAHLARDRKGTSMVSNLLSADVSGYLSQHQPRHTSGGESCFSALLACCCCCWCYCCCSAAMRLLSAADHSLVVVGDARVCFLCSVFR